MSDQCPSHDIFERLVAQSIENLTSKISEGIEALNSQSAANGDSIRLVLENQSARKEMCGKQTARVDNLIKSDEDQWTAINETRKTVWIGIGIIGVVQIVIVPVALALVLHFMKI